MPHFNCCMCTWMELWLIKKASHSQSVPFSDSFQPVVSGSLMTQSNSGFQTTLILRKAEPGAPPENNSSI